MIQQPFEIRTVPYGDIEEALANANGINAVGDMILTSVGHDSADNSIHFYGTLQDGSHCPNVDVRVRPQSPVKKLLYRALGKTPLAQLAQNAVSAWLGLGSIAILTSNG